MLPVESDLHRVYLLEVLFKFNINKSYLILNNAYQKQDFDHRLESVAVMLLGAKARTLEPFEL